MFLRRRIGDALAMFLDLSVGAFIALVISKVFGVNISHWGLLVGGVLRLIPDFDILYMYLTKGNLDNDHHQYITHRPLLLIPLVGIAGILLGGNFWALVSVSCVTWHYVHDTEGFGGGGIAWLWPFSGMYFSPKRVVSPEKSAMLEYNGHDEWLEKFWLRPSFKSMGEISAASLLMGITFGSIWGLAVGIAIFGVIWSSVLYFWFD